MHTSSDIQIFIVPCLIQILQENVYTKRYLLTEDVLQLHAFQQHKLEVGYKLYGEKGKPFREMLVSQGERLEGERKDPR
uniref:Uncharacterized protein n=1 Tax=Podarcis muralis TaxID=64176 RepID=A0A670IYQ7_PODMU